MNLLNLRAVAYRPGGGAGNTIELFHSRSFPMEHYHAVVWIDQDAAHVIHFKPDESEELTVHAKHTQHRKRGLTEGEHTDHEYFSLVEAALAGAKEILIVGPAGAKHELEKHMSLHAKALAACVVGVESADHPTDGQILQLARKYFRAADRLGQTS